MGTRSALQIAVEGNPLRKRSRVSGWAPCSAHPIHTKLWIPTQFLHFLPSNKQRKRAPWGALFYVSRWDDQSRHPTPRTSGVDFVMQSANPAQLVDLCWGRPVIPRPCRVLLGRLIMRFRREIFPFSSRGKRTRLFVRSFSAHIYLLQKRRTFQLHESINSFFMLEIIWLDPLRV